MVLQEYIFRAKSRDTSVGCNRANTPRFTTLELESDRAAILTPLSSQSLSFREVHVGQVASHVFSVRRVSNQTPKTSATVGFAQK